jgi:hypothetical protein
MKVIACPFCGVATDVPHETQELCIAALRTEIARVREMVSRVKSPRDRLSNTNEPELVKPS